MKTIFSFITIVLIALSAQAQDLIQHVPSNAQIVATMKGNKLLELLSASEFNSTYAGRKILEQISKETDQKIQDVQELGIDINASAYYYSDINDSINYYCILIPIKDAGKFDKLFTRDADNNKIIRNGNVRMLSEHRSCIMWDDHKAMMIAGSDQYGFFEQAEVMNRYGLKQHEYGSPSFDTTYSESIEDIPAMDTVAYAIPEPPKAVAAPKTKSKPTVSKPKTVQPARKSVGKKTSPVKKGAPAKKTYTKPKPVEEHIIVEDVDMPVVDTFAASATPTQNTYYDNYEIKDSLLTAWIAAYSNDAFYRPSPNSILQNASFVKSISKNDQVSVWMAHAGHLYENFLGYNYFARNLKTTGIFNSFGNMTASLEMDNKQIKINSKIEVSNEMAESYNKIYNAPLNKKLLNYVNEDKAIGYVSVAMSTKGYLEEYPKLLKNMLNGLYPDEAELGADIFSLFLDEEAVGKVIKGDGLFVFSGLSKKEVKYTTYDYDDNYKSIEIEKTKNETLPDFLFMASTDDPTIIQKIINYGIKKNVIETKSGYYKINAKDNPLDLYMLIKDGIFFLGTSETEVEQIVSNTFVSRLSKEKKDMMAASPTYGFLSLKKIDSSVIYDEAEGSKKEMQLSNLLKSMGDINFSFNIQDNNVLKMNSSMEVPNGETNGLKYLFHLIEIATKD